MPGPAASGARRWAGRYGERIFWAVCTLAFLSVGTFRAAPWLFFWSVLFAIGCAAIALAGGRTVLGLLLAPLVLIGSTVSSWSWIHRGFGALRRNRGDRPRLILTIGITVGMLIVFGALFAGADAAFGHLLGDILPTFSAPEVTRAIFCFVVVGAVACGVAYLTAARPRLDDIAPRPARRVRRVEWVLPLALLNVMFAAFVAVQLVVLFGADRKLLATASHDYMRGYAHSGFWQLLTVTVLTLTILAVTGRVAPRETRTDRVLIRTLLGGLTVFSLVIVASALKRVSAYEQAFGFTRLRVVVAGIEIWLGLLFVLVLIAGITLRAGWLPRVIVGSLAVSLFAGAVANPDRYVAQHNIDRYAHTGKLSISYLRQMSADAAPAILQLPTTLAACASFDIWNSLAARADDWRTWNFARVDARRSLAPLHTPAIQLGNCHLPRRD